MIEAIDLDNGTSNNKLNANRAEHGSPKKPTISTYVWDIVLMLNNPENRYRTDQREYKTPMDAEKAIITSLINTGNDFDDILEFFETHTPNSKFSELRAKDTWDAEVYLQWLYNNCHSFAKGKENRNISAARALRKQLELVFWIGRGAETRRQALIACCQIAEKCGRKHFAVADRTLAEMLGCSSTTASKALKYLVKKGRLRIAKRHSENKATRYQLVRTRHVSSKSVRKLAVPEFSTGIANHLIHSHDVFSFKGLGKSGYKVFRYLMSSSQPRTRKEIQEGACVVRNTVKKKLSQMQQYGMVRRINQGDLERWEVIRGIDLDEIARAQETFGLNQKRKELHERQRVSYRNQLDRMKAKRSGIPTGEIMEDLFTEGEESITN